MRIKILFLIFCTPLFIKAQEKKYDNDYWGLFFSETYKTYQFPFQFIVQKDTLFIADSGAIAYKKVFIISDSSLADSTGKMLWEYRGNHLYPVSEDKGNSYLVVNSYMIEANASQYFILHDVGFMSHIGLNYSGWLLFCKSHCFSTFCKKAINAKDINFGLSESHSGFVP